VIQNINKTMRHLARGCRKGPKHFSNWYFDSVVALDEYIHTSDALKGSIATGDVDDCERLLRFSLIFNDLTVCTLPTAGGEANIRYMSGDWFAENTGQPAKIIIEKAQLDLLDLSSGIKTGYITPTGDNTARFLKSVAPLIESGRLIVQPSRLVIGKSKTPHVDGRTMWKGIGSAPFTSLQQWEVTPTISGPSPTPIAYDSTALGNHNEMMEVVLPFIDGVSFNVLAKILHDEQDLLSSLRASIRSAVDAAKSHSSTAEIVQDLVMPSVDKIERKFKTIVDHRSLRIGGASVVTINLALAAAATGGLAAYVIGAGGGAGLSVVLKEYADYRKELDELKDNPHYFLWKCRRVIGR